MKFNWGWGILIVVLLFMAFILNMVYRCTQQRVDLVSDKYYEKEIKFQQQIDREKNTAELTEKPSLKVEQEHILIRYPRIAQASAVKGEITFFKPDNASFDFNVPVSCTDSLTQLVDTRKMSPGWWSVKVEWTAAGKPYYFEQRIRI